MIPNFLIIGAMRSGTTSLYHYLKQHPQIFMSDIKEPGYFMTLPEAMKWDASIKSKDQLLSMMLKGYQNQPLFGEASTYYTKLPDHDPEAPKNIHDQQPGMKFIYIIRNPLGRIISQYLFCLERGITSLPFNEAIAENDPYLALSLYHRQLSYYLKYFKEDQFKVIIFEEFIDDPEKTLRDVFSFLGVDPDVKIKEPLRIFNKGDYKDYKKSSPKGLIFSRKNYSRILRPIQGDIKKMESFLGRPLDCWDLSASKWCEEQ